MPGGGRRRRRRRRNNGQGGGAGLVADEGPEGDAVRVSPNGVGTDGEPVDGVAAENETKSDGLVRLDLSREDAGRFSERAASAGGSSSGKNEVNDHRDDAGAGASANYGNPLLDEVLSWTVAEVRNGSLYESKIKKIPDHFMSAHVEVQSNLLIEELRARVHLALLHLPNLEYYSALSVSHIDSSDLLYFDVDLDRLCKDKFNHSVRDGDLFLLTTQPTNNGVIEESSVFAMAVGVGGDSSFQRSFSMIVSKHHKNWVVKEVKYACFVTNIADDLNISRALSFDNFTAISTVLEKDESLCKCCVENLEVGEVLNSERYNADQIDCITSILPKLSCEHHKVIQIVWGYPATGKTLVACTLVNCLINSGKKILLCVPTESSISNLLDQLKTEFPSFNFNYLTVLNDINGNFAETRLDDRCHKLYWSVHLWGSWVKEMNWLLGLELYMPNPQTIKNPTSSSKNKVVQFSFGKFKRKFDMLLRDVRECSEALISSLSGICLSGDDVNEVTKMLCILSKFEELLHTDDITTSDVQRAFGIGDPSDETDSGVAFLLNETRMRCIGLIKSTLGAVNIPKLNNRNDLEQFCINHSRIIVCTPGYSSRLHDVATKPQIVIVDDAAQIRESDILIPLSVAPKGHIVLLGDHLHVQPIVKSMVCKQAGYGKSLFERLMPLSFDKKILIQQHRMHPSLSKLPRQLFYEYKMLDGSNVKSDFCMKLKHIQHAACTFFDVSNVDELSCEGQSFVESSMIMMLLEDLYNDLTDSSVILTVGIVTLCSSRAKSVEDHLSMQYQGHHNIHVKVNSIENMLGCYDVVILSSVCKNAYELPEDNRLNVVLTSSRHCIWIIGEPGILLSNTGTWKKLVQYMYEQTPVVKIDNKTLYNFMQQLTMKNQDCPVSAHQTRANNAVQKTGQEFTWKGRPHRTKQILADVRDQKGDPDSCSFHTTLGVLESMKKYQYAGFDPPEDFDWSLSLGDLKRKYDGRVPDGFLEEQKEKRGKSRLETEMNILKIDGVKGYNKTESKEDIFKISGFDPLKKKDNAIPVKEVMSHLRSGNIMAIHFRLSRNYFYLKPGECYEFDETEPYIHPKSHLPVSHAVMGIGCGRRPLIELPRRTHIAFQNSEGFRFGLDGTGRVVKSSVRGAYVMKL